MKQLSADVDNLKTVMVYQLVVGICRLPHDPKGLQAELSRSFILKNAIHMLLTLPHRQGSSPSLQKRLL